METSLSYFKDCNVGGSALISTISFIFEQNKVDFQVVSYNLGFTGSLANCLMKGGQWVEQKGLEMCVDFLISEMRKFMLTNDMYKGGITWLLHCC